MFHQNINHDEFWARVNEMSLSDSRDWFEKKLISKRLHICNNNLDVTAESLGMVKNNLYRKLKNYDIDWK